MTPAEREDALAELDARLLADPLSVDLALDRARVLAGLDRSAEARDVYLRIVARDPDHFRALNDFGTFLMQAGFRAAARTAYERALGVDPRSALAHANLANVLFAETDYAGACRHYEAALAIDPQLAEAHQGLSYALTRLGRETFLDDRIFRTTTLVADLYRGTPLLPPVDVVFNAISDADRAAPALAAMEQLLATVPARVVNAPRRVLATGREANAARLGRLEGVLAPRTVSVPRAELAAGGAERFGFAFPLLVRAPGFHSGQYFGLVERAADLAATIAPFPGDDVLLIEYVDLRGDDGCVRKYRMMAVDGALYPLHVAIAQQWKVHYFSAAMSEDAAKRAEDARFLADPAAVLGPAALAALERVRAEIALDYAGIDFALDRAGRVVVFEANATMIVLPPGPDPIWEYRRAPTARIVDAVRAMLLARQ